MALREEQRNAARDQKRRRRLARLERAIARAGGRVLDPVAAAIKTQCDLARTRVKDVFAAFDADGSGTVDRTELRDGVRAILGFPLPQPLSWLSSSRCGRR